MRRLILLAAITLSTASATLAQPPAPVSSPARTMAATVIRQWPAGVISTSSTTGAPSYPDPLLLAGMIAQWQATGEGQDFDSVKIAVEKYVSSDGTSVGSSAASPTLNQIELGRAALLLYRVTQQPRYAKAAQFLHDQLELQPRTLSGGYTHDPSIPHTLLLEDAYATEPFRAAYAQTFQQPQDFNDIARQLLSMDAKMRDQKSGLLHQGWDESESAPWADKATGLSPSVLAPAMGQYVMALVDVLDWFPKDHPQRPALLAALNRNLTAVLKAQDSETGLWWQVMDHSPHTGPHLEKQLNGSIRLSVTHANDGNLLEASSSCMFTYALAKGVRLGYLPQSDAAAAQRAWQGVQKKFLTTNADGTLTLHGTIRPTPPGADFNASIHQAPADQDPSGVGAFLLAGSEIDQATPPALTAAVQSPPSARTGLLPSSKDFHAPATASQPATHRVTVLVDAWFNSQTRKNALGQTELFHYKWDDDSSSGYSVFGHAFERHGGNLATLTSAPTRANLAQAQIYIIASPDIPSKNPNPHYLDQPSGDAIEAWVRAGGILLLFSNDRDNTEFTYINTLSDRFGLHFNSVLSHHVIEPDHSTGEVILPPGTGIFGAGFTAYMKDTSTITPSGPARALVTDHGDVMLAVSHIGKGVVLGVVDPWFYNEYADGRKMAQYRGFEAADDVAAWAVHQAGSYK